MKTKLLICISMLFCIPAFTQMLDLEVEPNHSTVGFRISISGFTEVTGKFTDYTIYASIDETDLSKSKFSTAIKSASINTGISGRDEHLRTADFFDAEKYPEITFQSDSIHQINYAQFMAFGKFSMHGVTKNIELPFTVIKKEGNTLGIKIRTLINRLDYGVGASFVHTSMPDFLDEEIQVEIDFWTRKKKVKKEE